MLKEIVLLLGVKTTLNKLAVNDELLWHVFSDFDSMRRIAETLEMRERTETTTPRGDDNIECLMVVVVGVLEGAVEAERRGRVEVARDFRLLTGPLLLDVFDNLS